MVRAALACHPATPCKAVRRIDTRVRLAPDGTLSFMFAAQGETDGVRMPAPGVSQREDRLWEHTCFEAFIRARDTAYYELNWSPSNEWAVYRFDDYRSGMAAVEVERPPTIALASRSFGFELNATISLSEIPELIGTTRLEIALAAVIEELAGRRSYWAVAHPAQKPDFHHPGGFVIEIAQTIIARTGASR